MYTFSRLGEYGRLGHQLFQIATTIAVARKHNVKFAFPKWSYAPYFQTASHLDNVPLEKTKSIIQDRQVNYFEISFYPGEVCDLEGNFQSEKFFASSASFIKSILTFSPTLLAKVRTKYEGLDFNKLCAIHVRRGDYLNFPDKHPILPMSYYQKGMALLNDRRFLVFSDDPDWCQAHFQGSQFTIVRDNSDIEDLCLMSLCQDFIISNSSFGWWGAYLAKHPDKRIVCPHWKEWFGPELTWALTPDLPAPNWIQLPYLDATLASSARIDRPMVIDKFCSYLDLLKVAPRVIFDIGSRDCMQAVEFSIRYPHATIVAFEANPNALPRCRKNIEGYPNIRLIEGAVDEFDGQTLFHPIDQESTVPTWKDGNQVASSLLKASGEFLTKKYVQDQVTIPCHRLDTICKQLNLYPDVIWIDLQGAEVLALRSLGRFLPSTKYIHAEVLHKQLYFGQCFFNDLNSYLTDSGFELTTAINPACYFEDAIYRNKFAHHPVFDRESLTVEEQNFVRSKPLEYIRHTIEMFKKYTDAKVIVEIGSVRCKMNHDIRDFNPACCNDGHSTYFWKRYSEAAVVSVDISPDSKSIVESDERLSGVKAITADAIEFLKTFDQSIDLLFLDAWDINPGTPYAEKHLEAYELIKHNLADNCLILIDDTDIASGGKGRLLIPKLLEDGFQCLLKGRQTLFMRRLQYDVIVPVGSNDLKFANKLIDCISKNVIGHRKIYLISSDPALKIDGCITVDEQVFPFSLAEVNSYIKNLRAGWYLQQLLKLYAPIVLKLDKFLVVDADTFMLRPNKWFDKEKICFNIGGSFHAPYFEHMKKLIPELKRQTTSSGICHCMPMRRDIVQDLITKIENLHGVPAWRALLQFVDANHAPGAGMSEYELLLHFTLQYHPDKAIVRPLKWRDVVRWEDMDKDKFDYACMHWYSRQC